MAPTQILVQRWDPEQGFWCCFTDGPNQSLVSSVAQAPTSSAPTYVTLMKAKYMQVMPRCHIYAADLPT